MNSGNRDCIVLDGEAVGLSAALAPGCARRLALMGTLMCMSINDEPDDEIVAGGAQHPCETA
jgi:hypothetical protein